MQECLPVNRFEDISPFLQAVGQLFLTPLLSSYLSGISKRPRLKIHIYIVRVLPKLRPGTGTPTPTALHFLSAICPLNCGQCTLLQNLDMQRAVS